MRGELFGARWQSSRSLASLSPVLDEWGKHPALARFTSQRPAGQRFLWVQAPAGLGREWFALSWLSSFAEGMILDLTEPLPGELDRLPLVEQYLREYPGAGVCVIAAADTDPARWQTTFNRMNASAADLLLTRAEADEFYALLTRQRQGERAVEPKFARAWAAVGGWLHGLASVHRFGPAAAGVHDEMAWLLNNLDSYAGVLADYSVVAFLPFYDDELLAAWIKTSRLAPVTVAELCAIGLLVEDREGPLMPSMIRRVLQEHFCAAGGLEGEVFAQLLRVLLETRGLRAALDAAVGSTSWSAVGPFLDEYWVNVMTEDPALLLREYPELSSRLLERFGDGNLAGRVLAALLGEGMDAWPPSPVPYEQNQTVARLLQSIRRANYPATARTLSSYLLLVNYLRMARYYGQASEHARRLRKEVTVSYDHYSLNPLLRAYIYIVVGSSLLEDMDFVGAGQVFEKAYKIATEQENAHIAADAASKLAVLKAFEGDFPWTDEWVRRAFDWAEQATWGRRVILRCAYLARAFSELHQLRLDSVQQTLAELRSPQREFLWEFELFLRAVRGVLVDDNDGPIRETEQALAEQRHQLSPLGITLLETIPDLAHLRTGGPPNLHGKANPNQAFYYLMTQDMEGLASLLRRLSDPLPFGVHARLAAAIGLYLTLGSEATMEEFGAALTRTGKLDFTPLEVLVLTFLPRCRRLVDWLGLPAEQAQQVGWARDQWATLYERAPELTPREAEVLDLLRRGHSRAEIAELTFRSVNTVKAQLSSLYRKLEVKNRAEALERARRLGL